MPNFRFLRAQLQEIPPNKTGGLIDDHAAEERSCLAFGDKTFAGARLPQYGVSTDRLYLRRPLEAVDE